MLYIQHAPDTTHTYSVRNRALNTERIFSTQYQFRGVTTEPGHDFYALPNPCCHVLNENQNKPMIRPKKWDATDIPSGRGAR